MASEGAGTDTALDGLVTLLSSPSARNAAIALAAAAGVFFSARSLGKAPRVPDKDDVERQGRQTLGNNGSHDDRYIAQSSRRHIRRSSSSSTALGMSNSGSGSSGKSAVAIFWDVDNCSPPTGSSGHTVAQAIRKAAQSANLGSELNNKTGSIVSFKAYLELSSENSTPNAAQVQLRSELQGSGVSLIDTPKSGRKDVADKMMIADLLSFAIDKRPPALIVLLSGDRDFAYPLGILRNRGYDVLLITPPIGATPILEASATHVLKWRQDVLGIDRDAYGRLYDKEARRIEESGGNVPSQRGTTARAEDQGAQTPSRQTPVKSFGKPSNLIPSSLRKVLPPTPPVFVPLVQVLEQLQIEGHNHPKRSIVALRLRALDPKVYEKAGANSWGEYVAVAESAGIVTLGNGLQSGMEWIALRGAPGPIPPGPKKGSNGVDAPANVSGNPAGYDVSLFYPLIEVWKQAKAGLPPSENPSASAISSKLDTLVQQRYVDVYTQAGVRNFEEYARLAEQAKIGRVSFAEGKQGLVEIHPRYSSLHTGMVMPSNNGTRMLDTSKFDAPEARQSKIAAFFSTPTKKKEAKAPESSKTTFFNKECPFPLGPPFPHQPSGEIIHAAFFPLANCLLTHRAEGQYFSPDFVIKAILSKHHKTGKFVSTSDDFEVYIARAEQDDIVRIQHNGNERMILLAPRLCKGEGQDRHKGHARGIHSGAPGTQRPNMSGSDNSSGELEISDSKAEQQTSAPMVRNTSSGKTRPNEESSGKDAANNAKGDSSTSTPSVRLPQRGLPSQQFNTIPATSQDRARFKPLIDTLVNKRRQAQIAYEAVRGKDAVQEEERLEELAAAIVPLRAAISTALLTTYAVPNAAAKAAESGNGPSAAAPIAPGAWLQGHGFASFGELYTEAEQKGFIHLVRSSTATGQSASNDQQLQNGNSNTVKDRVRLAERYERMFFPEES